MVIYCFYRLCRKEDKSLIILGNVFRHAQIDWCRICAIRILKSRIRRLERKNVADLFWKACDIDEENANVLKRSIEEGPHPFHRRLIILSPPQNCGKGVLLVKFTDNFGYFNYIFDLERISQDYVLVLEPSSSGYFNPNILFLIGRQSPIVIQTPEKVDFEFIEEISSNMAPIAIGANHWVDNRVFYPLDHAKKEYDIIMVANWGDVKRHYHLFKAVAKCKNKSDLRVALVGTPWPNALKQIQEMALYYNVDQNIDYFEKISQKEVNMLLNKSKICLLLSKKEGFNKAIIEAMFSNIPVFLLKGFNYGQHYDYINSKTGDFVEPSELTEFIENIDSVLSKGEFSPNEWVRDHMTVEKTTEKLIASLSEVEEKWDLRINKKLDRKINNPDCDYVNPALWSTYSEYYGNLKTYFR